MDVQSFLHEMDGLVASKLAGIERASEPGKDGPKVRDLLVIAMQKELEAAEEAAMWMIGESDLEVRLSLMRQCGDEAKHYRLIEARLRDLGADVASQPLPTDPPSPMFQYLGELSTTVERIAAGPFAREALAKVQNELFIQYCDLHGDRTTADLYREKIQPDELFHHEMGRRLLARLATTAEAQLLARNAIKRTLDIAEEVHQVMRARRGITCPPGC